jgi:protein SCO1
MKLLQTLSLLMAVIFTAPGQDLGLMPQSELEIGVDEKLGDFIPETIFVINEEDDTLNLLSMMTKPTILNLVYYRCPGICSPLMEGLADVIDRSDLRLGEEYQVFTVSFDPREDTELALRKKRNHLNLMTKKELAEDHWQFFTADSMSAAALTNAVGFRYKRTGNDFLHSATLIVLSPEGKITRYLNGINFLPFEVKLAIMEASEGRTGTTINKIIQYCYSYDPAGQTYVLNITKVVGIIVVLFTVILFIVLSIKPLLRKLNIIKSN